MLEDHSSLLDRIKSKYIFRKIISFAFKDVNSLLKLIRCNKNLTNKLEINIKDYYNYKVKRKIEKEGLELFSSDIFFLILLFIQFLVYIILFYVIGTFNKNNLRENYNVKKKNFVDFMDNYILIPYFCFIIIKFLLITLLFLIDKFYLTRKTKLIISILIDSIDLIHLIFYVIKTSYIQGLLKESLASSDGDYSRKKWFYDFNISLSIFLSYYGFFIFSRAVIYLCSFFVCGEELSKIGDKILIILNQINGINISDFKLPEDFDNLCQAKKDDFIFKRKNIEQYRYKLDINQINLIDKINDIRKHHNLYILLYYIEEQLPDFIINPKIELILFNNDNIYKISENYYIFKYPKNKFQNYLYNKEILNILTLDFLDRINIIAQNNIEFISIYNHNYINKINIPNNNKQTKIITINKIILPEINNPNTKDKFKIGITNLSMNEISNKKRIERIIIKNNKKK